MRMRLMRKPARYALRAGMAGVLALGVGGLVAATSASASPAASGAKHCSPSITKDNFGTANSGPYGGNETVWRYTMTNSNCMQVRVITYGATVQSITVPAKHGQMVNVVLGFWPARHQRRRILAVPTSVRPSAVMPTGSVAPRSR
jgi:hypothetical protein